MSLFIRDSSRYAIVVQCGAVQYETTSHEQEGYDGAWSDS